MPLHKSAGRFHCVILTVLRRRQGIKLNGVRSTWLVRKATLIERYGPDKNRWTFG
jgi:hypothetical protein